MLLFNMQARLLCSLLITVITVLKITEGSILSKSRVLGSSCPKGLSPQSIRMM